MTSTTTKTVTVSLVVQSGLAKVWASTTDGFYDPKRFPERVLLDCKSGEAATEEIELDSGKALVLRVEDAAAITLQYSLFVDVKPLRFLEVVARPYEYKGRVDATEYVKHRLDSVKPIARIRGYKVLPEKASEHERIVEFKPTIPAGARWL
jgi:hypothetical protein